MIDEQTLKNFETNEQFRNYGERVLGEIHSKLYNIIDDMHGNLNVDIEELKRPDDVISYSTANSWLIADVLTPASNGKIGNYNFTKMDIVKYYGNPIYITTNKPNVFSFIPHQFSSYFDQSAVDATLLSEHILNAPIQVASEITDTMTSSSTKRFKITDNIIRFAKSLNKVESSLNALEEFNSEVRKFATDVEKWWDEKRESFGITMNGE